MAVNIYSMGHPSQRSVTIAMSNSSNVLESVLHWHLNQCIHPTLPRFQYQFSCTIMMIDSSVCVHCLLHTGQGLAFHMGNTGRQTLALFSDGRSSNPSAALWSDDPLVKAE